MFHLTQNFSKLFEKNFEISTEFEKTYLQKFTSDHSQLFVVVRGSRIRDLHDFSISAAQLLQPVHLLALEMLADASVALDRVSRNVAVRFAVAILVAIRVTVT